MLLKSKLWVVWVQLLKCLVRAGCVAWWPSPFLTVPESWASSSAFETNTLKNISWNKATKYSDTYGGSRTLISHFFKYLFLFFLVSPCGYVHLRAGTPGGQEASEPLESQAAVILLTGALETELRSSARVACALNC